MYASVNALISVWVLAGASSRTRPPPVTPPTPAPALAPSLPSLGKLDNAALLAMAVSLYNGLDYDRVVPVAQELLRRTGVDVPDQLEAYRLLGSAEAIVGDPSDAEKPFRLLLRLKPDYAMPDRTPPKIQGVFRKVQLEERALADDERRLRRSRLLETMTLTGELPKEVFGGYPLRLSFRLKDPTGVAENVEFVYRRQGGAAFSALALQRDETGAWRGTVPGGALTSAKGFTLEYYVQANDASGPLTTIGSQAKPQAVIITSGETVREHPPPVPRWAFYTGLGATGVLGVGAAVSGLELQHAQNQYAQLITMAQQQVVSGDAFASQQRTGQRYATLTNVALVGTAVAAVVTAILIPFVNWDGVNIP
jgi:hypothetical protein